MRLLKKVTPEIKESNTGARIKWVLAPCVNIGTKSFQILYVTRFSPCGLTYLLSGVLILPNMVQSLCVVRVVAGDKKAGEFPVLSVK